MPTAAASAPVQDRLSTSKTGAWKIFVCVARIVTVDAGRAVWGGRVLNLCLQQVRAEAALELEQLEKFDASFAIGGVLQL
jgi:hypothetical protein